MVDGKFFNIRDASDIRTIRVACTEICLELGFGNIEIKEILLALSELCTNVLRFAGHGKIEFCQPDDGKGIKMIVSDQGPGIENIDTVLDDGFSTFPESLGIGLGVAERASDCFSVNSVPGKGTTITITKFLRLSPSVDFAVETAADSRYPVNGDICFLSDIKGDRLLIAVIDGLGEGIEAERSSRFMYNYIERKKFQPLDKIITGMHDNIKSSGNSGGAISLLVLKNNLIEYAGIGDTFVTIYAPNKCHLTSQQGIVGQFTLPNVRTQKVELTKGKFILAMCTDGIKDKFVLSEEDTNLSAREIATSIFKEFKREFGDATVFVIKGE